MKLVIWVAVCRRCHRMFVSQENPKKLPRHRKGHYISSPSCPVVTDIESKHRFVLTVGPRIELVEDWPQSCG